MDKSNYISFIKFYTFKTNFQIFSIFFYFIESLFTVGLNIFINSTYYKNN